MGSSLHEVAKSRDLTYSRDEKPFGLSWEEWTAKWWQWGLSIPKDSNPILDEDGRNAAIRQDGPVWFLAGTFGGLHERTCEIPVGKAILFAISNNETSFAECPKLKTEDELRAFAKDDIDRVKTIMASIDGIRLAESDLRAWRVQSPFFDLELPSKNVFGVPAGKTRAASDGYWVFLKPLSPGDHEIHFFSSCRIGTQWIEARYHITVK